MTTQALRIKLFGVFGVDGLADLHG
jgi:hypothetical protein